MSTHQEKGLSFFMFAYYPVSQAKQYSSILIHQSIPIQFTKIEYKCTESMYWSEFERVILGRTVLGEWIWIVVKKTKKSSKSRFISLNCDG